VDRQISNTNAPAFDALLQEGIAHHRAGRLAEAEQVYKKILQADPQHTDSLNLFGIIAYTVGRYEEAELLIGEAIRLRGDVAFYHTSLGNLRKLQKRHEEAKKEYKRALQLKPDTVEALNNLGLVCYAAGGLDEAAEYYKRALEAEESNAEVRNNYGLVLKDMGLLDEALAQFRRAIELRPDYAGAHWNIGFILLLRGEFAEGWKKNEWRWKLEDFKKPGLNAPVWQGEDISGKTVLLYCEQGLGDSIQFIRYAKCVRDRGARVVVPCPPPLARLFGAIEGIDIISHGGQIPPYEYCAPLLSLPAILGNIVADTPYLYADAAALPAGRKIGVAWRGSPTHANDHNRSMTAAQFAKFLKGQTIVNLQKDATENELRILKQAGQVVDAASGFSDFADTAAAIAALDLVISVDTSVCHLAGALGAPVWTLLPFAPDWRWLLEREDTPWYPSMRLFRQDGRGDWRGVIERVRGELAALCAR
jgi:Flp pilus assembly protein TadD